MTNTYKQIATLNTRNLPIDEHPTVRVQAVDRPLEDLPTDKVPSIPTVILPAVPGAEPLFDTHTYGLLHVMARQDRLPRREFERRLHIAEWKRRMIWRDEEAEK